jgi:hypothetical protein
LDDEAHASADLFVLRDAPVLEALRIDRTEVPTQPQAVTGTWG